MDRLSQLPDEILIHILSFLSTEEACRTSLLSKHWRFHWLCVGSLDFNTSAFIKPQMYSDRSRSKSNREKLDEQVFQMKNCFFKWVTKALRHHAQVASVLNKLRIQFPLPLKEPNYKQQIDEWVSFAFAKRVRSLELDLNVPRCLIDYDLRLLGFLGTETDMSCLVSLSLSGINVSMVEIDYVLSNCPFLQHLKVRYAFGIESVEIRGSDLALKHLEITNCARFRSAIFHDSHLVSLKLCAVMNLVLENNPKLVSVCVVGRCYINPSTLTMLSGCLSKLQILTLHLQYIYGNCDGVSDQVPKLSELKQLTLVVDPLGEDVHVRLTTMLSLCPNLEKLVLDLVAPKFEKTAEHKKGLKVPLQHLKAVEVRGYCGEKAEDELFIYVFEHVEAPIEAINFDPRTSRWCDNDWDEELIDESVETRVELLKRVIPSSVKFFVL